VSKGKFIVIEGGEGSGKTTIVKYAKEIATDSLITREPGGSVFAEKIRSIILSPDAKDADANTQFGLFWAARADHVKNLIAPAIVEGKNIITDRFDASSYAYQVHGQENPHLKELFMYVRKTYLNDTVPDLYIFLDVDPKIGIARRASDKGYDINHFDERTFDFHERVRTGYFEFFKAVPHVIIDANQSLEKVKKDFKKALENARIPLCP